MKTPRKSYALLWRAPPTNWLFHSPTAVYRSVGIAHLQLSPSSSPLHFYLPAHKTTPDWTQEQTSASLCKPLARLPEGCSPGPGRGALAEVGLHPFLVDSSESLAVASLG